MKKKLPPKVEDFLRELIMESLHHLNTFTIGDNFYIEDCTRDKFIKMNLWQLQKRYDTLRGKKELVK